MAQLDEVLKFPVIKQALEIIVDEGTDTHLPTAVPGVDYTAQVAAFGARSAGWAAALKALRSLSKKPTAIAQMQVNQSAMYIDEAIKRVAASMQYTPEELSEFKHQK